MPRARRLPRCHFSVSVDRKACSRPGYMFLRFHLGKKLLPGGCHATSRALRQAQASIGKLVGCRP